MRVVVQGDSSVHFAGFAGFAGFFVVRHGVWSWVPGSTRQLQRSIRFIIIIIVRF